MTSKVDASNTGYNQLGINSSNNNATSPESVMDKIVFGGLGSQLSSQAVQAFKNYVGTTSSVTIRSDVKKYLKENEIPVKELRNAFRNLSIPYSAETEKFEMAVQQLYDKAKADEKTENVRKEGFQVKLELEKKIDEKSSEISILKKENQELRNNQKDLRDRISEHDKFVNKAKGIGKVVGLVTDTVLSGGSLISGIAVAPFAPPVGGGLIVGGTLGLATVVPLWALYGKESIDQAKGKSPINLESLVGQEVEIVEDDVDENGHFTMFQIGPFKFMGSIKDREDRELEILRKNPEFGKDRDRVRD